MPKKITITEGEFAGWQTYDLHDTFDTVVGPFYGKPVDPDHVRGVTRLRQATEEETALALSRRPPVAEGDDD
ncbi:MAG: hypothetical protein EON96_15125 [Caulobacteraceae bacterium]|nr:MAG: hypothetical protein EON96_15125 [Caulobacteraceae bacterium]